MQFNIYGLLIGIGVWGAVSLAQKGQIFLSYRHTFYRSIRVDAFLIWVLGSGVFGARFYHVIDYWDYYVTAPWNILAIWQGGIGIYGAILGGLIGLSLYLIFKERVLSEKNYWKAFFAHLDVIALGLPLGQAIGRWGNYVNQELFGMPTTLPWGVFIEPRYRPVLHQTSTHFHPLFLYESLLSFFLLAILWMVLQRKYNLKIGAYWAVYLVGYGVIRFGLDYLRFDAWSIGIFTTAQWISLVGMALVEACL